ncbi:hypothetical protein ACTS93_02620 [Empedobacter falsenii]
MADLNQTVAPLSTIISWFAEDAVPTDTQFETTWKSFFHKSENIPVEQIYQLAEILNLKAERDHMHFDLAKKDGSNLSVEDINGLKEVLGVALAANGIINNIETTITSEDANALQDGIYKPKTTGVFTAIGLTAKENYTTLFKKLDGVWSVFSEEIINDNTALENNLDILFNNGGVILDKDYTIFSIPKDPVWNFTEKIAVKKGYEVVYKGFSAESIGNLYDKNNVLTKQLPLGNSLTTLNTIKISIEKDGYIELKSARLSDNNFNLSSVKIYIEKIYADVKDLSKLSDKYLINNTDVTGVGTEHTTTFGNLNQTKYYIQKENFDEDKLINYISMFSLENGDIEFSFGIIDQWNKFIERKSFKFNSIGGQINTYYFNDILLKGEYIAIKCPSTGMSWKTNATNNGKIVDSQNSYDGTLIETKGYDIAWAINYSDFEYNKIAFVSDLDKLNERVTYLENKSLILNDKVTNTPYEISIVNGVLTLTSLVFNNILHLGNSICRHEITPFWWGDWGMAATKRENDYVHKFLTKYQEVNPSATSLAKNIAHWETDYMTYDKNQLNSIVADVDLITISVGENVTWSSAFKQAFKDLILHIISHNTKKAKIIVCGEFWFNTDKDRDMKDVATELGLSFISFEDTQGSQYKSTIDTKVYGDDNQWHTISDGGSIAVGVAKHPNDIWFELKANRIMKSLGY